MIWSQLNFSSLMLQKQIKVCCHSISISPLQLSFFRLIIRLEYQFEWCWEWDHLNNKNSLLFKFNDLGGGLESLPLRHKLSFYLNILYRGVRTSQPFAD